MAMPMDSTVASQVPFHDLSLLLEKTGNTQGKEKKKDLFRKFLDLWRDAHRRMHDESETTVGVRPF